MKILLIVTLFLSNILFANYNYNGENNGKIDMHGGKNLSLVPSGSKKFENMDISKPFLPVAPKALVEEKSQKKDEKKENKK